MYNAIVSSDWSECLAPCSPFDCISFNYPELTTELETIFKQYTSNIITLGEATRRIQTLLPTIVTIEQMDAYLDNTFSTYKGVAELIEWCLGNNIIFMINTTGMIGYFQRVFAKGLLPPVPVISAHPMVRYPSRDTDPDNIYDLFETNDKGKNTETVAHRYDISSNRVILLGDSGGDGPHFEWGAKGNAFLIGSMIKPSLEKYCRQKKISINLRFGISYAEVKEKDLQKEMQINFGDLSSIIEDALSQMV
jgi:2-hydroxy-3-keto-5-methylthiopentenyl-1-phosphate phosphatase